MWNLEYKTTRQRAKCSMFSSGPEKRTTERIRQAWEEIVLIEIGDYGLTIGGLGEATLDRALSFEEAQGRSFQEFFYVDRTPAISVGFPYVEPLGSMEIGSEHVPSWNITVLNGELTGAINYLTSSTSAGIEQNVKRVPQLDFDVNYRVLVGDERLINIDSGIREIISDVFEDGTFLYLSQDVPNIILAVDEENSPIDVEYDIEVFSVERGPDGADEVLIPLSFQKQPDRVVDGILLDEEEIPVFNLISLDPHTLNISFKLTQTLKLPQKKYVQDYKMSNHEELY